jgi:hypothetical protein
MHTLNCSETFGFSKPNSATLVQLRFGDGKNSRKYRRACTIQAHEQAVQLVGARVAVWQ